MIVDVHARGLTVTPALAEHARRRLHSVLSHRGDVIRRIAVRLGGAGDRRGPNDMYCLMQIHMSDALVATVVDMGAHVHDVIDRATDRVGRLVAAHLDQASRDRRSTASSASPRLRRQGDALAAAGCPGPVRARAAEAPRGAEIGQPRPGKLTSTGV
ncbi:MAG TPA: hypothetical protein VGE20_17245 [Ramlibacter sp.]